MKITDSIGKIIFSNEYIRIVLVAKDQCSYLLYIGNGVFRKKSRLLDGKLVNELVNGKVIGEVNEDFIMRAEQLKHRAYYQVFQEDMRSEYHGDQMQQILIEAASIV